jgi:hypothetical protein
MGETKAGEALGGEGHSLALHTISALPLDPDFPLFQHYPAMKVGVLESVRHYARLLVPLVETIMNSRPESAGWVLTAPPLHVMPAGANLLAWEMARILGDGTARQRSVRGVDLHYSLPNPHSADLSKKTEYSGSGLADRIDSRRSRMEGVWAPKPDPADFHGRDVIVVNDINVTGTHQRFIQGNLETAAPARIHWIYIVQVDPDLGRAHPEVENSLNYLGLKTFEEFAAVVAGADIEFTSRCISRLLRHPEDVLASFIRSLDETRRRKLHQLINDEGAYQEDEYRAKLALLREGVS